MRIHSVASLLCLTTVVANAACSNSSGGESKANAPLDSGAVAKGSSIPGCAGQALDPVADYGVPGPFPTTVVKNTGSDGTYTVYRPETLGENGFKHPVATWGNGIFTDPLAYPGLLGAIASHGIVVVASNSTTTNAQLMTAGLDWLVAQNDAAGDYQGMLNTTCLIAVGYSLGGGGAVNTGSHADVVTTISFHGLPGAAGQLHGPLLLFTSTNDTVVAPTLVDQNFASSSVPTFYATLSAAGDVSQLGHLLVLSDAGPERAPAMAWLRYWIYGDEGAKSYFFGDDCILCTDPWQNPQRKNW